MARRAGGPAGGAVLDDQAAGPTRAERRHAREQAKSRSRPARVQPEPEPHVTTAPVRSARRARRRRAERRRFWLRVIPALALALAATAGVGAWLRSRATDSGPVPPARSHVAAVVPRAGALLLAHRGALGQADLMVVVGAAGGKASILLIPTATQVEVPSLGVEALADLPNAGSAALLQTTVENLLGVRVASTLVTDDASLVALLTPAAPLRAHLSRPVTYGNEAAPALAAGAQRLSAAAAAQALTTPQPGSELDRLVTTQAVLDAWLARLKQRPVAAATTQQAPALAPLVQVATAPGLRTDTLPVQSIATGGGERFEARRGDLARYVRDAFGPMLLARSGTRPRVEILNGTGAVGVAEQTAAQVVPAGGEVTLSGNVPGFGLGETQVVYYSDAKRPDAQRLLGALGCGALKKADGGFNVVDVTILVGADCPALGAPGPG